MYVATRFQPASAKALANGQVIIPYLSVLAGSKLEYLIDKHGIRDVDPQQFYSQSIICDMQAVIVEEAGLFSGDLVDIGIKSIDAIGFPEGVNTVESALGMLHDIYQMIHQNVPKDEGWSLERTSDKELKVLFNSPYKPYAAYGYVWGIARRFTPKGMSFTVYMDEDEAVTVFRIVTEPETKRPVGR